MNAFTDQWHDDTVGLIENANEQVQIVESRVGGGDTNVANTFVGEATGLLMRFSPLQT